MQTLSDFCRHGLSNQRELSCTEFALSCDDCSAPVSQAVRARGRGRLAKRNKFCRSTARRSLSLPVLEVVYRSDFLQRGQVEAVEDRRRVHGDDSVHRGAGIVRRELSMSSCLSWTLPGSTCFPESKKGTYGRCPLPCNASMFADFVDRQRPRRWQVSWSLEHPSCWMLGGPPLAGTTSPPPSTIAMAGHT